MFSAPEVGVRREIIEISAKLLQTEFSMCVLSLSLFCRQFPSFCASSDFWSMGSLWPPCSGVLDPGAGPHEGCLWLIEGSSGAEPIGPRLGQWLHTWLVIRFLGDSNPASWAGPGALTQWLLARAVSGWPASSGMACLWYPLSRGHEGELALPDL